MSVAPAITARCIAFMVFLWLSGCAGTGSGTYDPSPQGPGSARTPTGEALAPQSAMETIAIGKSTKADIAATLGKAIVVAFDSGNEVWAYRWVGADKTIRGATELVVLFDASGVASKVRLRPGYPPRD
ncbi:MAG: hypothetical protein ABIO45_02020 [Burkholderiaceae bacterium]